MTMEATWAPTSNYGVVLYNFDGGGRDHRLNLAIGDKVHMIEEVSGWFRGYSVKNPHKKGIFPANYVKLKKLSNNNSTPANGVDPMAEEIQYVLHEWKEIWKRQLFVLRDTQKYVQIHRAMDQLIELRRQLLMDKLTVGQLKELKLRIAAKINWGNKFLDLDLVPREEDGTAADPVKDGVCHVFNVHVASEQRSLGPSEPSAMAGIRSMTDTKRDLAKQANHHILLKLAEFSYQIGEEVETYFSLYSSKQHRYISEKVLVSGTLAQAIFMDVGTADQFKDLYLVCHVMRIGRMLLSDKKGSQTTNYKRPFAAAVINIGGLRGCSDGGSMDFESRLYQSDDKDFNNLHKLIITSKGHSTKFSQVTGVGSMTVSLRVLMGEAGQIRKEQEMLFKAAIEVRRLGFPNVIMPGDVRNDLYVTLEAGHFERGGKAAARNIEVTTRVLDRSGLPIDRCIVTAAGRDPRTVVTSPVLYHTNSPCWGDTMRLQVPIEKFNGAHVRFEYRHCSTKEKSEKKLIGFSFVHLMDLEDETTLKDGCHVLCLYKCEDPLRLNDPNIYLPLAARLKEVTSSDQVAISQGFVRNPKESITVRTQLISTKLTQNVDLMTLLRWKTAPEKISETLNNVMKLDGEEIVKFLQDVLDTLFSMFSTENGNSTSHSGLVFHVLVSIISFLENPKFEHFRPVLDAYISQHFSAALVYKGLLTCVRHCADLVTSTEKQEPIKKCFKSLEYIVKFVIQSRVLFMRASGTTEQSEDSFREDIDLLFSSFNKMLSSTYEGIIHTQFVFLQNIASTLTHLVNMIPVIDIVKYVTLLYDSLPSDQKIPTKLIRAKLQSLRQCLSTPLMGDPVARRMLLSNACMHTKKHLVDRQELSLYAEVIGDIITYLHTSDATDPDISQDIEMFACKIVEPLIQTLLVMDRAKISSAIGSLVSCLMGTFQLMDEFHFSALFTHFNDRKPVKDLMHQTFLLFRDLATSDSFPQDWSVMRYLVCNVMLKTLQEFAKPLVQYFQEPPHFDSQLWSDYFVLAVAFMSQPALQLETFAIKVKRHKILTQYGDMRLKMGLQVLSLWARLGPLKKHFIPGIVGPFLEMTLLPEPELRKATLPLFVDLIHVEQKTRGNFRQVETELIDKLDILVSDNKGDEEYKQLFNTILLDSLCDERDKQTGQAFVESVTQLLERLLDYRNQVQSDANKRMSCTVNLLNFYKSELLNRQEMYLRYIYKLYKLHKDAENWAEAGFTLKLHADLLEWSNKTLHSDLNYPTQKEWQRKEQVYLKILEHLDRGKVWEHAIPLCKELAQIYEKKVFDYSKLSSILKRQASFYDRIISNSQEDLRLDHEYFRVGFYGTGFPMFVRNKEFVYRGLECEKISDFTSRLSGEYPHAQILTSHPADLDTIKTSAGQFIQIFCVKPIPDPREPSTSDEWTSEMPEKIRSFYLTNEVNTFRFDRPFHKGDRCKDNEFKTLWLERTTLRTRSRFPGILRWFEVSESSVSDISPIDHASETIHQKNEELRRLTEAVEIGSSGVNSLTQCLSGVIDAAVNGGVAKYCEAFFAPTADCHGTEESHRLYNLMWEQVRILEAGLTVHERLVDKVMLDMHWHLVSRLREMKSSLPVLSIGSPRLFRSPSGRGQPSIVNMPLPPTPPPAPVEERRSSNSSSSLYHYMDELYTTPSDLTYEPAYPSSRYTSITSDYTWLSSSSPLYSNGGAPPPRPPSKVKGVRGPHGESQHDYGGSNRDSGTGSNDSYDELPAPPLPPRSSVSRNCRSFDERAEKPVLPRKNSMKHPLLQGSDNSESLPSPRRGVSAPGGVATPPPLPPKSMTVLASIDDVSNESKA